MARRPFRASIDQVAWDPITGRGIPGAQVTIKTVTDGTVVTDLADMDGTPLVGGIVTADQYGAFQFLGDLSGTDQYLANAGLGDFLIRAADTEQRVGSLEGSIDALSDQAEATSADVQALAQSKGQPGGLATLGDDGKVPSEQLPPGVGPTRLGDLDDVQAPTPANGQGLIYQGATGLWVPGAIRPTITVDDLPTPWIIPHRGGAGIMPEETMDAYRAAVALTPIIDVDLWSLHGGGLGVMHDSTMDRTTAGQGAVVDHAPHQFISQIVQTGDFYGPYPTTQYPMTLDKVFTEFGASVLYTPEIKSPANDPAAGPRLLDAIRRYQLRDNCIIQANDIDTLTPFVQAGIATCLGSISSDSVAAQFPASTLIAAGIRYVSVSQTCSDSVFTGYAAAGLRVFAWTVDRQYVRDRLMALSPPPVGYFTNEPGYLSPTAALYQRTSDMFRGYRWDHGMMLSATRSDRYNINLAGATSGGVAGYLDGGAGPQVWQMLQGYLAPITAPSYSLTFKTRIPSAIGGDNLRWCSVFLSTSDRDWVDPGAAGSPGVDGYHFVTRMSGGMTIYRVDDGVGTQIGNRTGQAAWPVNTWQTFKITVGASALSIEHVSTNDPATLSATDSTYRPLRYPWVNFNYNASQQIHVGGLSVA